MNASFRLFISSLCATLVLAACKPAVPPSDQPAPDDLDPLATAVRALTGARTRVVWLQDMGDGTDLLARGVHLQLMGYDTDDARGPRRILPPGRNMAKPMFTVDGDRIAFSDRHQGTMHLVPWEGGDPEPLGNGFVLTTWRDPDTDIEWLYYAKALVDDGKTLPAHEAIYRKGLPPYPLNLRTLITRGRGRLKERPVWSQTRVSEDSYQLSADGRFASAPFPWPEVGIHDIAARRWNRHGRGCWVAMAPDNSYHFWIFDGPHRNLLMEQIGRPGGERWAVNISQLPDTDPYEVYHPRWSNHPRIIAVTGPYKVGEGAYRLYGGGTGVEIHLGRFAEDHRSIEEWLRLTENAYANFYPDVWVAPIADGVAAKPSDPQSTTTPVIDAWPARRDELIYLWQHGAAQNEIENAAGARRIFRPEAARLARLGARHSMWTTGGYFVEDSPPDLPDSFALEMMLQVLGPVKQALVWGYGPEQGVLEIDGHWVFRNGEAHVVLGEANAQEPTHMVLNVTPRRIEFFVNGERLFQNDRGSVNARTAGTRLYFGGHPDLAESWDGLISHIALYNRPLAADDVAGHHQLAREETLRMEPPATHEVRARVVAVSSIPSPADIAPYRRGLVVNEYERTEGERAGERFLAAHWAILDGVVLDTADRPVSSERVLFLVLFDERPELEGERVSMDSENFLLELYYDLNL